MAIAPVPAFPFPRRPFSSITPFTYSDAMTHLELLEKLRVYAGATLPAEINRVLDEYSVEITDEVQAAIDLMIGTLNDKIIEINDALEDQQADYTQKISDLTVYVDDAVQQIINNSIEVQDPVVAGIVGDNVSATRQALDGLYAGKDSLVYDATTHGVIGDGSVSDSDAMQALISAVPDGATIKMPSGSTLRSNGWNIEGKSVHLDFTGSHLIQNVADSPIVSATGEFSNLKAIASITNANTGSTLFLDNTGFEVGDIVKVYANNAIPDARPRNAEETGRVGEFAQVQSVGNGTITVTPRLYDEYTASPRVAKLNEIPFSLTFGTADYDYAGSGTTFGNPMFALKSLMGPRLSGRVLRGAGVAVSDRSNYAPRIDIDVKDLPEADGYGVTCSGSQYGTYIIRANRCRHAFTDDTSGRHAVGATNDPGDYGRAMYADVTGSSQNTGQSSWNTHHGGVGHRFHDITAVGVSTGLVAAFGLRGESHQVVNCSAHNCYTGLNVYTEQAEPWATSQGHYVSGFVSRGTAHGLLISNLSYMDAHTVTVDGGDIEGSGRAIAYIRNAKVAFNNTRMTYKSPNAPSDNAFINVGRGVVTGSVSIKSDTITSGAIDAAMLFVNIPSPVARCRMDVELELGAYEQENMSVLTRVNGTVGSVNFTYSGTGIPMQGSPTEHGNRFSTTFKSLWGNEAGSSSAQVYQVISADTVLGLGRSGDKHVNIRCANSVAGAIVSAIRPGAFDGQILTVRNAVGSTEPFTISNSAVVKPSGALTLAPGESVTLVWQNSSTVPQWEVAG